MPRLNLDTLELVSTLRRAPANGSPSSHDYNDSEQEKLIDLAAIAGFLNDVLRPVLTALPEAAEQGLEGRTLYTDTTDQDPLFYDALGSQALTVTESLRLLSGIINSVKGQMTDLSVEVGQMSAKLASTSQNDVALALRNMNDTIRLLEQRIAALEAAA